MAVVTQIQWRRGTAAQWTSANPTLASGEAGFETDTGKAKIGNGTTAWNSLAYAITGEVGDITGVTAGTGISGGGTSGTVTVSIDTAVTADLTTAQTLTNKTLTSPILTTPALGTPASGTLTNTTGLPISGLVASTTTALGVGSIELGNASDTTLARGSAGVLTVEGTAVLLSGGALGTPSSGTLTNATGLPVSGITASTSSALGVGSIELGNASDTTLSRSSAGVLAVEGVVIPSISSTNTLTNKTLTTPVITQGTSTPSFTTNAYTLVAGDAGQLLLASNSTTAGTITIPLNATTAFATGTQITILQTGSGQLSVVGASGVTLASVGATSTAPKCRAQYSAMTIVKTSTDTWYAMGDIS